MTQITDHRTTDYIFTPSTLIDNQTKPKTKQTILLLFGLKKLSTKFVTMGWCNFLHAHKQQERKETHRLPSAKPGCEIRMQLESDPVQQI